MYRESITPINRDTVPDAVEAANRLNKWVNQSYMELRKIVTEARFICGGHRLSKKDRELADPILRSAPFRAWLSTSEHSSDTWLHADITHPSGSGCGCRYIKLERYICPAGYGGEWNPLTEDYSAAEVLSAFDELAEIERQISDLEDKRREIANRFYPFVDQIHTDGTKQAMNENAKQTQAPFRRTK